MELVKISELPIKEITTVDAYLPIIDNVGEDIENYRISLLNLFKTGGIINVNRTYGDTNYTLQTALAVIEPTLLVNGVFITFKGMNGWELYQKELDTYVKYLNRIDDELEVGSNNPLSNDAITRMYHELLSSINSKSQITHQDIQGKNDEADFQHVTQEEKTGFHTHNNKEYLDNYNPTLFATALQGEKADSALQSLPPNTVIDADYTTLKDKVNGIEENANNYEHPLQHSTTILSGVSTIVGSIDRYLNQRGDFTKPTISHIDLTYKNEETSFQHIDTTTTKETLVEADKVTIFDSETGKIVLTNKSNVGGGTENNDILYADLIALISNNKLIPNSSYRITNYTTTTVQADTQSVGHDFDVVVTALSNNELSEIASCVRKSGDTYFENANLEAWEIKYCIDNDTSRFAWADTVNGKGVIYYMKDEWNNECPYDFKNIKYLKNSVVLYTFGGTTDDSLAGGCHYNVMMEYTLNSVLTLNFNTFGNSCYYNTLGNTCYSNAFGTGCYSNTFSVKCDSNTFGNNCYYNTFGNGFDSNVFGDDCYSNVFGNKCDSNTFGNNCYSNVFGDKCDSNTFGNNCSNNTFDDKCYSNTFGDTCSSNKFGTGCYSNTFGDNYNFNTFGNNCLSNTFGNNCFSNTFGNYCSSNELGDGCGSNTFGNSFQSNKFGNGCYSNTFGSDCCYNNFYAGDSGTTKKNYIKYLILEDGCRYNNFYSSIITNTDNYLQRIRVKGLEHTTSTNTQITLSTTNNNHEWLICYTSDGILKQYYSGDSLINNYDAETVAAPANAGILTLKNATETVVSTTLTNSNSFTIALPTAVAGKINESILIFKTGATLPTLIQPSGVIYRTAIPTIAINQTWVFCYERVSYDNGLTFETYVSATPHV